MSKMTINNVGILFSNTMDSKDKPSLISYRVGACFTDVFSLYFWVLKVKIPVKGRCFCMGVCIWE